MLAINNFSELKRVPSNNAKIRSSWLKFCLYMYVCLSPYMLYNTDKPNMFHILFKNQSNRKEHLYGMVIHSV